MITTYSYLDQYKQIGLVTPIDYFSDVTIVVVTYEGITQTLSDSGIITQTNSDSGIITQTNSDSGIISQTLEVS